MIRVDSVLDEEIAAESDSLAFASHRDREEFELEVDRMLHGRVEESAIRDSIDGSE